MLSPVTVRGLSADPVSLRWEPRSKLGGSFMDHNHGYVMKVDGPPVLGSAPPAVLTSTCACSRSPSSVRSVAGYLTGPVRGPRKTVVTKPSIDHLPSFPTVGKPCSTSSLAQGPVRAGTARSSRTWSGPCTSSGLPHRGPLSALNVGTVRGVRSVMG